MWQCLKPSTGVRVPELDRGIVPAAGQGAAIGSVCDAVDPVRLPTCPEQCAVGDIPQLNGTIPAPTDQLASVWAEGDAPGSVGMRLPDPVQRLAARSPHPQF